MVEGIDVLGELTQTGSLKYPNIQTNPHTGNAIK